MQLLGVREFSHEVQVTYVFGICCWVVIYLGNLLMRHLTYIFLNITTIESHYKVASVSRFVMILFLKTFHILH